MHHPILRRFATLLTTLAVVSALLGASTAAAAPVPGVDWELRTTPTPASFWTSIAFGNGRWVALSANAGNPAQAMTSTDGITWSLIPSVPDGGWFDMTYANGMFVAVADVNLAGQPAQIMTSADGLTWTVRATGYAGTPTLRSVTYGNGRWVVVNEENAANGKINMLTSTDGVTWTVNEVPRTSTGGYKQTSVAFGDGVFVAVLQSATDTHVLTSNDGLAWTERSIPAGNGQQWQDVTYGNGTFVAVASGTRAMSSTDGGATWTVSTLPTTTTNPYNSVTFGSGKFVAVGKGTTVLTSPDGTTWTPQTTPSNKTWLSVAYGRGQFIAVTYTGPDKQVLSSGDLLPPAKLTVAKQGLGSGTVTSTPAGIDCGAACSAEFEPGEKVTLTATASTGSTFTGWSDGCTGTATTCTLTLNAATTVTATFAKAAAAPTALPPLKIAKATGTSTTITTVVRAPAAGRAVMSGTVGGKAAFKPGSHVFTKPSTATIRTALNDRVRALLRVRDVRVKITVRFIAADGRTTTSTRTVLLKKIKVRPEPVTG